MYALIKAEKVDTYPYSIGQFQRDNPRVSLPRTPTRAQLEELGIFEVIASPKPQAKYNEVVEESLPVKSGSSWTQVWSVRSASKAETDANVALIKSSIYESVSARLDNFARSRGYDDVISACSYAYSSNPKYKAEGQYCVDARDSTWSTLFDVLAQADAGTRPMPNSYSDVEPLLPALSWPS